MIKNAQELKILNKTQYVINVNNQVITLINVHLTIAMDKDQVQVKGMFVLIIRPNKEVIKNSVITKK